MRRASTISEYFTKLSYIEQACGYEMEVWGCIRYETLRVRHYLLKRLLQKQMEEFDAN